MVYHLQLNDTAGSQTRFGGFMLDTSSALHWLAALAVTVAGALVFEMLRRRFAVRWNAIQSDIEQAIKARGASA
jgi:branched-chain amino acid transport system permease protein